MDFVDLIEVQERCIYRLVKKGTDQTLGVVTVKGSGHFEALVPGQDLTTTKSMMAALEHVFSSWDMKGARQKARLLMRKVEEE